MESNKGIQRASLFFNLNGLTDWSVHDEALKQHDPCFYRPLYPPLGPRQRTVPGTKSGTLGTSLGELWRARWYRFLVIQRLICNSTSFILNFSEWNIVGKGLDNWNKCGICQCDYYGRSILCWRTLNSSSDLGLMTVPNDVKTMSVL